MTFLQIQTIPLGQGLPSLATLLFNCQVHGIVHVIDRKPVNVDNDDEHHKKKYCTGRAKITQIMLLHKPLYLSP